jgi:hypothetical protein
MVVSWFEILAQRSSPCLRCVLLSHQQQPSCYQERAKVKQFHPSLLASTNTCKQVLTQRQPLSLYHILRSTRRHCLALEHEGKCSVFTTWWHRQDYAPFEFSSLCQDDALYLDARDLEPTPKGFLRALAKVLELGSHISPLEFLTARQERTVLLLDTHERLKQQEKMPCRAYTLGT